MRGFKIICLNCGNEDVEPYCYALSDELAEWELICHKCSAKYGSLYGNYKEGKKQ